MSISRAQFRSLVIDPTLARLGLPNPDKAAVLLEAIAAYESQGGRYLKQVKGPALGPWQMEPATEDLVWDRLWDFRDAHGRGLLAAAQEIRGSVSQLATEPRYACAMARLLLWFNPVPLPAVDDKRGQYDYYIDTWRPGKPPSFEKFVRAGEEWT